MVLNAILVFFLGLIAFIFMQYDTFYDREVKTTEMLKSAELSGALETLNAKEVRNGLARRDSGRNAVNELPHNNPVRLLSFMKNSTTGEKALYRVIETQFNGDGDVMYAKNQFMELGSEERFAAIKMALITSDRSRITSALPTVLFLISSELYSKNNVQFLNLVATMDVLESQRSLLERILPYMKSEDKVMMQMMLEKSAMSKERIAELTQMLTRAVKEGDK